MDLIKLTDQEKRVLSTLDQTEYGQALFHLLDHELSRIDKILDSGAKICDDPIKDDIRFNLGSRSVIRSLLKMPQELKQILQRSVRQ